MIEETDFDTFLYISKNKYQIIVFDKNKLENLYNDELKNSDKFDFRNFDNLKKFLDNHIYKIEKLVGNFIKDISIIIENDENLDIKIGIKKKNYEKSINPNYLENNLIELKDLFKENYQDKTIMHMIITDLTVDGKKQSLFSDFQSSDYLCLEVKFLSISNQLILLFDKLLKNYQIKISQYMCGNYIKDCMIGENCDLSLMTHKVKSGFNSNEVIVVPKNNENTGFFEKFFQLFS